MEKKIRFKDAVVQPMGYSQGRLLEDIQNTLNL